jgi:DNA-binding response OmpR family regulator
MEKAAEAVLFARTGSLDNEAALSAVLTANNIDVAVVRDAESFLELVRTGQPDVVIVDYLSIVDDANDMETYRTFLQDYWQARRDQNTRLLEIMPATPEQETFIGIGKVVDAYMTAPVDPSELLRYVRRLLSERERESDG